MCCANVLGLLVSAMLRLVGGIKLCGRGAGGRGWRARREDFFFREGCSVGVAGLRGWVSAFGDCQVVR